MTRVLAVTVAAAIVLAGAALTSGALAGEAPALLTASGKIEKADKESVTIQPRVAGGKFGKNLVLKVTGTTKLTVVSEEKRAGKMVPVQRDIEAKDLEAGQNVAVIYFGEKSPILLTGVVRKEK